MNRPSLVSQIRLRYFRPVIANPEGAVVHYGDCLIYECKICSCGLLSDLSVLSEPNAIYPRFSEESIEQSNMRNAIFNIGHSHPELLAPPAPMTEEELAEFYRNLNELLGKSGGESK